MPNCKITKPGLRLPCLEEKARYCPFYDSVFIDVLEYYVIHAARLPSNFWNRKDGVGNISIADISNLFDGHDFVDYMAAHFKFFHIVMTRQICKEMKAARAKWWRLFAPAGYRWYGDPIDKPKRFGAEIKLID